MGRTRCRAGGAGCRFGKATKPQSGARDDATNFKFYTRGRREMTVTPGDPLSMACTSLLMFAIGFNTDTTDVRNAVQPQHGSPDFAAFVVAIVSNVLVVPALAIVALHVVPDVPPIGILGIMIISLCPGGPAANVAALISGANTSLNAICTATEQLLSLLMVPFGLIVVLPLVFDDTQLIRVPWTEMVRAVFFAVAPLAVGLFGSWRLVAASWKKRVSLPLLVVAALGVATTGFLAAGLKADLPHLPESSTIHAGIFFGCLVIAWGLLAGYLTPHQPFANRNSILLEICVRDLAISLPIAMLGLPALSLTEKLEVVAAELVASPVTNLIGILVSITRFGLFKWRQKRLRWLSEEKAALVTARSEEGSYSPPTSPPAPAAAPDASVWSSVSQWRLSRLLEIGLEWGGIGCARPRKPHSAAEYVL